MVCTYPTTGIIPTWERAGFCGPGDYNSRILLLVDGHRVNDNVYDAAFFGREAPVPVDMIERIEFVRGPSSSIYGSSAFFGIVNVVLKHAKDIDGAAISAAGGSLGAQEGARSASADGGQRNRRDVGRVLVREPWPWRTLLSGVRSDRFPQQAGGQRWHRVGSRRRAASVGLTGSVAYGGLRLEGAFVSRRKDVPTASFDTVFDRPEETRDERAAIWTRLTTQRSRSIFTCSGALPTTGTPTSATIRSTMSPSNRDDTVASSVSTEWQLTRTLAGGRYRWWRRRSSATTSISVSSTTTW